MSGKVTDDAGEGLPGVNVVIKGTTTGVTTDLDGNYRLSVDDGVTLVFSFVGFETQEVQTGSRTTIDITMSGTATELSEVVITAVGIERERKEIGYSVTTVDGDELTRSRTPNFVNALSGKVAGVQVTQSGGSVGASSRVIIRGVQSINGDNQPLYVVDGVPISNRNRASVDRFTGVDYGNRIQDINPDDIESLTVLKGAAATVLYGQRAGNGAVIITTKKGKKGSKVSVSVNSSVRFDNPFILPKYQNSFGQGSLNKRDSAGTANWGPSFSDRKTIINSNGAEEPYVAHPDNVKDFYETGRTIINSVAFSGGDDKSTYRMSVTNFDQEGHVPNTELRRVTATVNATRNFDNKFRSGFGVSYSRTRNEGRPITGFNDGGAVGSIVSFLPRNSNIDSLRNYINPDGTPRLFLGLRQNPYWSLLENVYTGDIDRVIANASLGYRPTNWLDIQWKIGSDVYFENRKQRSRPGTVNSPKGEFWSDQLFESQINSDLIVTIAKEINKDFFVTGILGHNTYETFLRSSFDMGQDLIDPLLYVPQNATTNAPVETQVSRIRVQGAFFDVGVSFRDYLFLNVTGRNDWSSTLPVENRSFYYPGISASAVLTEAIPSLQSNLLSFLRVRASVAEVANGTNSFLFGDLFFPQSDIFQLFGVDNTYPFRGVSGVAGGSSPVDDNLKPERTRTIEFGTEAQFWGGRLLIDATYYRSITRDQIVQLPLAPSTGFLTFSYQCRRNP